MAIQPKQDKAERLLNIKTQIDEAKSKADQLRGTLSQLESQLKQFGCKTVEEAKKKLDQMDAELTKSEKELEDGIAKLESSYEWGQGEGSKDLLNEMRKYR